MKWYTHNPLKMDQKFGRLQFHKHSFPPTSLLVPFDVRSLWTTIIVQHSKIPISLSQSPKTLCQNNQAMSSEMPIKQTKQQELWSSLP